MQTILTRKYLRDQFDEELPGAGLHTVTSLAEVVVFAKKRDDGHSLMHRIVSRCRLIILIKIWGHPGKGRSLI